MQKTLTIDGKEIAFRATAAVPRLYRIKFGRDIIQDMGKLQNAYAGAVTKGSEFQVADLEVFENCAYIMARHAAPDEVSDSLDEWLEQFETFSIYQILPELMELWALNVQSTSESKKKLNKVAGN